MSEDKLSLASQVCLDKLPVFCQAKNSQDLLGAFLKIAKMKSLQPFTVTYDRKTNLGERVEIEKAQWQE